MVLSLVCNAVGEDVRIRHWVESGLFCCEIKRADFPILGIEVPVSREIRTRIYFSSNHCVTVFAEAFLLALSSIRNIASLSCIGHGVIRQLTLYDTVV
jgi:hypothetical protein